MRWRQVADMNGLSTFQAHKSRNGACDRSACSGTRVEIPVRLLGPLLSFRLSFISAMQRHLRSMNENHLRENLSACSVGLCSVAAFRKIDDRASENEQWPPQRSVRRLANSDMAPATGVTATWTSCIPTRQTLTLQIYTV